MNKDRIYDPRRGILQVVRKGLYWFHFAGGCDYENRAQIVLINENTDDENHETQLDFQGNAISKANTDIFSRDLLVSITEKTQFHLRFTVGRSVSWCGFTINTNVAFNVANTKTFTAKYTSGILSFPFEYINNGNGWLSSGRFVAPDDGYYFFSLFLSVENPTMAFEISLNTNSPSQAIFCAKFDEVSYGGLTLYRNALIRLETDDEVTVSYTIRGITKPPGQIVFKSSSFSGFLYCNDYQYSAKAVWYIYTDKTTLSKIISGNVQFNQPTIKNNIVWDTAKKEVKIKSSGGIFYLSFTLTAASPTMFAYLLVENEQVEQSVLKVDRLGSERNVYIPREKSIIYKLKPNIVLSVFLVSGNLYYESNHANSFLGILLYPE